MSVTALVDAYPSKTFKGTVKLIEPAINPQTRSAKVRILFDNPGNLLKSEMFANIELKNDLGSRLAVPKTAIIDTGIRKVVYIDFGDGSYKAQEITTGAEADNFIEVTSGLKAGDKIVTNGNFMLDSESQLKANVQSGDSTTGAQSKPATQTMPGMDMTGKK